MMAGVSEGGLSTRTAAARFSVGISTAEAWARLKRATAALHPAKQGKPKGSVLDAHADFILGLIEEAPGTTLDEGILPVSPLLHSVLCFSTDLVASIAMPLLDGRIHASVKGPSE